MQITNCYMIVTIIKSSLSFCSLLSVVCHELVDLRRLLRNVSLLRFDSLLALRSSCISLFQKML